MIKKRTINFLKSSTVRLALSYLAIIMVMSVGFSIVFYYTSSSQLSRQLPPGSFYDTVFGGRGNGFDSRDNIDQFLRQRIGEGQSDLLMKLIWLNLLLGLGVGSVISYFLARYTLRPIEEAMETQSRFVSDASHELRTPLTAIQAGNEVFLRRKQITVAEAKKVIESNVEEVSKLKKLSDGLLTLARQDNSRVIVKPVSMQNIVSESLNQVVDLAMQKEIKVNDSVPDFKILAEKQEILQVLVILLDNAIKYSEEGSNIYLEGHKKGNYGYVSVRDDGPGIRASDQAHIFERFYRANTARTKNQHDGYGLGLSIAKKIVERNHGKISIESILGKGSTFTIKMPLSNL